MKLIRHNGDRAKILKKCQKKRRVSTVYTLLEHNLLKPGGKKMKAVYLSSSIRFTIAG